MRNHPKTCGLALAALVLFTLSAHAGTPTPGGHAGYPVSGAFAYVDRNDSTLSVRACAAFLKFGVSQLSGNAVGELIVFDNTRRLDFGGYADTEAKNLSTTRTGDREFTIVDLWHDDGEGGGRPGLKKKKYILRLVDFSTIDIKDTYGSSRYIKCERVGADEAKSQLPEKLDECTETTIVKITDRFGKPLSLARQQDDFDPGTIIEYGNRGMQVSYERESSIARSKVGDRVVMCLKELPKDCPPGDNRGRVYNTKNLRTGEAWTLADSQHSCGGA
jgi:hypothetical protein